MNIHQDVILDLLPTYYAGEASVQSRQLIESYFSANPEFARAMHATQQAGPAIPKAEHVSNGLQTVQRVRSALNRRAGLLGASIGFSLAPFSFVFDSDKGLTWLMLRDAPVIAGIYVAAAAFMWIFYLNLRRSQ